MAHPNFILGLSAYFLVLLGVVLHADSFDMGPILILAAIGAAAVHWIWSIIDVVKDRSIGRQNRLFWITLVVMIPTLAGLIYYAIDDPNEIGTEAETSL
jgi:hypothetical protein